jgi:hypothetical protein
MRVRGSVGPYGLSVLILFALLALGLAVIGWNLRNGAVVSPLPSYQSGMGFFPVGRGIIG